MSKLYAWSLAINKAWFSVSKDLDSITLHLHNPYYLETFAIFLLKKLKYGDY